MGRGFVRSETQKERQVAFSVLPPDDEREELCFQEMRNREPFSYFMRACARLLGGTMRILLYAIAVLSFCFQVHLYAEDGGLPSPIGPLPNVGPMLGSETGGAIFSPLSVLPGMNLGKVILNPYAQVGYQKIGSNLTFPIDIERVLPLDNRLQVGTMELTLQEATFWTGTVGLNAVLSPTITLFSSAGGFSPKDVVAPSYLPISLNNITGPAQMYFTGVNVEYWFIQVGASFGICGGWSLLAGYFWDHFAMEAVDPKIGSIPFIDQTLKADFLTKTSTPFIGLQLNQTDYRYRASIIYSPVALCRVLMATRSTLVGETELLYSFDKPGQFVAVNAEYDTYLSQMLFLSLWATGSWMKVTGDGELEYRSTRPAASATRNTSDVSVTKYSVGGGFGLGVLF